MLSRNARTSCRFIRSTLYSMEKTLVISTSLTMPKPRQIMASKYFHQSVQRIPTGGELGFPPTLIPQSVSTIDCRMATMEDKDEIVDFLTQIFIVREPLMKVLKASVSEAKPFLEHHVEATLVHNASFVALDESGKICGIRLNSVGPPTESEYECTYGPKMNTVHKLLSQMEDKLPEMLNTTRFIRHVAICVKPEIVQRGVGTMLMKRSVEFARNNGLKYMVATCTGKVATNLALKMGFRVVRQIPYDSFSDPECHFGYFPDDCLVNNTFKPFIDLSNKHYSAKLMIKNVV